MSPDRNIEVTSRPPRTAQLLETPGALAALHAACLPVIARIPAAAATLFVAETTSSTLPIATVAKR